MTNERRMKIERQIAKRTIKEAFADGYKLGVFDGEELTLADCADASKVFAAMFTTDEDWLRFYRDGKHVATVYFVYGNDGYDVIADYHVSLDSLMARVQILADKLEDKYA
jgi:hypothetical protein